MAQAEGQLLQDQSIQSGVELPSPASVDDQPLDHTNVEVGSDEDALIEDALLEDVLVEEVSIDGMCGVY